jgi:uncharacterized SAM-binding protein YcdF (DUF218 family)
MSEYLKFLATPFVCILFFLVIGLFLMRKAKKTSTAAAWGWNLSVSAFMILFLMGFKPVASLLVNTLESAYLPVQQAELKEVDIIIVLGGGIERAGSYSRTVEASGATYSRLFNGVEIFKKSTARKLIVSGLGYDSEGVSEAAVMKKLAIALGIPPDDVIVEERSNTTLESILELRSMGLIKKGSSVGLVTSAIHMMRSVRTVKKAFPDIRVVPMPCGYLSRRYTQNLKMFIPSASDFALSSAAVHEWIGIVWYMLKSKA